MLTYKAPLRELRFLFNEVFDYPKHYASLDSGKNADPETVNMILEGFGDFAENVLAPFTKQATKKVALIKTDKSVRPQALKKRMTLLWQVVGRASAFLMNMAVWDCQCR